MALSVIKTKINDTMLSDNDVINTLRFSIKAEMGSESPRRYKMRASVMSTKTLDAIKVSLVSNLSPLGPINTPASINPVMLGIHENLWAMWPPSAPNKRRRPNETVSGISMLLPF